MSCKEPGSCTECCFRQEWKYQAVCREIEETAESKYTLAYGCIWNTARLEPVSKVVELFLILSWPPVSNLWVRRTLAGSGRLSVSLTQKPQPKLLLLMISLTTLHVSGERLNANFML